MIDNLKDLKALLKLCRANGVTEITIGTTSFKLGEMPERPSANVDSIEEADEGLLVDFPDGALTPEELTFFANGGEPKDNPYRPHNEN